VDVELNSVPWYKPILTDIGKFLVTLSYDNGYEEITEAA
jgi:hypothetical protein